MREQIDRFLMLLVRVVAGVWFRRIEVVGGERLPGQGPVLIVASHFNGILDPVLVAYAAPRLPRFLAKSTFWRNAAVARLMDLVGALPVQRASEGATEANVEVFEACHRALANGEAVSLFPEGITHDEPRIARLRTGAARIALGARRAGAEGLRIVPVGLLYSAKASPRSRALVRVGQPIVLDRDLQRFVEPGEDDGPTNAAAVRRLTDEIRSRLAEAALDYEHADLAMVASLAAAIVLRPPAAARGWQPALDDLERCARALVTAPAERQLEVLGALSLYLDELSLLGVTDADLVAGDLTPAALRWRLGRLGLLASGAPVAGVGLAVNGPAVALVWAAGLLKVSTPMRATARILTGLAALPCSWLGLRWLLDRRGWREPTLVAAAAGPASGLVALALLERLRALRSGRDAFARLREHESMLPTLWHAREEVVSAVHRALE